MSGKIKAAIIGCGRVGGHHARAILANNRMELVALCDNKPERGQSLLESLGQPIPVFTNYFAMLEQHPEIDVVAIVTPSGMHFEHSIDVINHFSKHVVVEKPIVMRLSQGVTLGEAAKQKNVTIFPVFQYRFNRCVQRIKQAIKSDELGDIFLATVRTRWCRPQAYYDRDPWRGTFALDGGCCTNQGIHHLDLLRYLNGEIVKVNAQMRTYAVSEEIEDTVIANVEFENGAVGSIEITTAMRPSDVESSISIIGTKGMAMVGGWATDKLMLFSPKPEEQEVYSDTFPDPYGFGHNEIYNGVCDTLLGIGAPAVEYQDALKTIRLLHSLYRSDEDASWIDVEVGLESQRLGKPDDELAALYRTTKI